MAQTSFPRTGANECNQRWYCCSLHDVSGDFTHTIASKLNCVARPPKGSHPQLTRGTFINPDLQNRTRESPCDRLKDNYSEGDKQQKSEQANFPEL